MARPHRPGTAGGPQTRWGTCSCGWASDTEHRGVDARAEAYATAVQHAEWADEFEAVVASLDDAPDSPDDRHRPSPQETVDKMRQNGLPDPELD